MAELRENLEDVSASPRVCKKVRYSSTSPIGIDMHVPHNSLHAATTGTNPGYLSLRSAKRKSASSAELDRTSHVRAASEISPAPKDVAELTDFLHKKLMAAKSVDDAKVCTIGVVGDFGRAINARVTADLYKENMLFKEQVERLTQENTILKRAAAIQLERLKEDENKERETEHLKESLLHYKERLRTLEVNNYALSMHLKQASESTSVPENFHPDVF